MSFNAGYNWSVFSWRLKKSCNIQINQSKAPGDTVT